MLRKHPNRLALWCAAWCARSTLTLHRHQSLVDFRRHKKQNHPPKPGGGHTLRKHPNRLALWCAAWSARSTLTLHRHQSLKLSLLILCQDLVHLGFS